MPNNATIRKIVSQRLSHHRMQHTLGVEMTAIQLARLYGLDEEKACTAALLHDYAKQLPSDRLLAKAQAYGLEIGDFERAHPDLLHGPVAAKMAEEEFAIHDPDILEAITYHTTGKVGMGTLAQIIYLADSIEPHRKFPEADELRRLSLNRLPEALYQCARHTMIYLAQRNIPQHPATQEVLTWFKQLQEKEQNDDGTSEKDC